MNTEQGCSLSGDGRWFPSDCLLLVRASTCRQAVGLISSVFLPTHPPPPPSAFLPKPGRTTDEPTMFVLCVPHDVYTYSCCIVTAVMIPWSFLANLGCTKDCLLCFSVVYIRFFLSFPITIRRTRYSIFMAVRVSRYCSIVLCSCSC